MRKFILVAFVATACTPASEHSTSTGTEESTTRGPASDTGASTSSVADTSTGAIAGYHPEGFAAAEVHGPELKLHTQDCRACHGNDLKGGSADRGNAVIRAVPPEAALERRLVNGARAAHDARHPSGSAARKLQNAGAARPSWRE